MPKISVISVSIRPKGLTITQKCLAEQTEQSFEWITELGIPQRGNDLSRALNRALRRAKGKWVVMLQDYIRIPKNGLQRLLEVAGEKKLVCGSMGKTLDWKNIKWDWRYYWDLEHKGKPIEYYKWEGDWAIAPLKAFKDVGGYNEEYDDFWSFDNVELAFRLNELGYTFWVQSDNKAIQYDHDKVFEHPFRKNYSPEFHDANLQDMKMGIKPIKLNYL